MKKVLVLMFGVFTTAFAAVAEEKVSDWGEAVNGLRMRVHYSDKVDCFVKSTPDDGVQVFIKS